jgi:hypothetical protein
MRGCKLSNESGVIGYVLGHVRGRARSPSGFAYLPSSIGIYFEEEPGRRSAAKLLAPERRGALPGNP